jgi:ABC-type dipeptide/oligopeptide/nickel transport system permease subunit
MSDLNERVEETIDSHQAPGYKPERAASLWGDAWRDLRKRPAVIGSGVVILVVLVMAFFPTLFTDVNPTSCNIGLSKQGPSDGHPFGFSAEGCDYFAQTIHGAGPSIKLSLLVVIGTLVIGGLFGILAGFYGGWVDVLFSRAVDVQPKMINVITAGRIAWNCAPRNGTLTSRNIVSSRIAPSRNGIELNTSTARENSTSSQPP